MKYTTNGFISEFRTTLKAKQGEKRYEAVPGPYRVNVRTHMGEHSFLWDLNREPVVGEHVTVTFEVEGAA